MLSRTDRKKAKEAVVCIAKALELLDTMSTAGYERCTKSIDATQWLEEVASALKIAIDDK